MLLVVIAAGCIIYCFSARSSLGNLPAFENPLISYQVFPWEQASSLLPSDEQPDIALLNEQPSIEETFTIDADVSETHGNGSCGIRVTSDGRVMGKWKADYNAGKNPRMNYFMHAEFKGNIDPEVLFFDEDGEDPTKLFFIAKGQVMVQASEINGSSIKRDVQELWVAGWVDPDYIAEGELVMVSATGNIKRLDWKSSYRSMKRNIEEKIKSQL